MNYTHYSSRKFKTSHIKRLHTLKEVHKKLGEPLSMQAILIEVVEAGLRIVESREVTLGMKPLHQVKRVVPFGIKEMGNEDSNIY